MGFWHSLKKFWDNEDIFSATESINVVAAGVAATIWLAGTILIAANYTTSINHPAGIFSRLLFFSAAAFVIGVILGFFFGIPKTLQRTNPSPASGGRDSSELLNDELITNTNLEQISDWLTKIVVGLGLVNFKKIPVYAEQLRVSFAKALPGTDESISYCVLALVIYAAIAGFIFMYIYTRVNISSLFLKNSIDGKKLLDNVAERLNEKGNEAIKESFMKKLS